MKRKDSVWSKPQQQSVDVAALFARDYCSKSGEWMAVLIKSNAVIRENVKMGELMRVLLGSCASMFETVEGRPMGCPLERSFT